MNVERFSKSDPFVRVSVGSSTVKSKVIQNNLNPEFNFRTQFLIYDPANELLRIHILDDNDVSDHIALGVVSSDFMLIDSRIFTYLESIVIILLSFKKVEISLFSTILCTRSPSIQEDVIHM